MGNGSSNSVRISWPRYDRDELVARLRAGLKRLDGVLDVRRAVLFGSWARGRQTAASDVDVVIVYGGPRREDAYVLARRHVAVRGLEPHVYSEQEYESNRRTVDRMTAGGIELVGTR